MMVSKVFELKRGLLCSHSVMQNLHLSPYSSKSKHNTAVRKHIVKEVMMTHAGKYDEENVQGLQFKLTVVYACAHMCLCVYV